ncbi:Endonuclease/exonuclease/phosphatase [Armillaria novae-zelandiae]|uniref:Endonuclease/exonuclease/phosphatase n=1 Tax=Armillaria novae-zelandiae TaxID=153914 RepID=A0AA39NED0_9AGAR|nr:Endonuclease/exonuclease/phosphatase [Armillaria novae-zelandiae]
MPTTNSTSLRIATYNIGYDSKPDQITLSGSISALKNPLEQPGRFLGLSGEQPWSTRRLRVAESLSSEKIVIVGFQEASERQVHDLVKLLGDEWAWIGVGGGDGMKRGEYCPIFYKKSIVKLHSSDTFWISDTPFTPSQYPGAGQSRLCTVARFSAKSGAKTKFTVLNTHLDARSDSQRRLGTSLILARARYEAVKLHSAVFVMGDFNSVSTGKGSGAYNIITGARPPVTIDSRFAAKNDVGNQLPDFKMLDLRGQAPKEKVSSNFATYTGFNKPSDTSAWRRIDYIFGGSNRRWKSKGYKVRSSLSDDGILASDHRPVFADITI